MIQSRNIQAAAAVVNGAAARRSLLQFNRLAIVAIALSVGVSIRIVERSRVRTTRETAR